MAYTYKYSNIFSYGYIDGDASLSFETIVYCKVKILVSISTELFLGNEFERVIHDIHEGKFHFYKTYNDGEKPITASAVLKVD